MTTGRKIAEHALSAVVAGIVLLLFVLVAGRESTTRTATLTDQLDSVAIAAGLDVTNPTHAAVLEDTYLLTGWHTRGEVHDAVTALVERYRARFSDPGLKSGSVQRGLTPDTLGSLAWMTLQFIGVYVLVLTFTYYVARSVALFRFINGRRQEEHQGISPLVRKARRAGVLLLKGIAALILFSPAYVVAYAIRSSFDTASLPFVITLAVTTNGILVQYAGRLTTLLTGESKRGYVDTARVKNLNEHYAWNTAGGIRAASLFAVRQRFPGHLLDHLYRNAHLQWIPTMKEHGAFLITGLMIIEMALNIQGHLGYELLQRLLAHDFAVAGVIMFILFVIVKATDLLVDLWHFRDVHAYANADAPDH